MIIEREDSVELEEDENLADSAIGGLWVTFRNAIPPLQAKELDEAFNLIMISDEDSDMPSQLASLLVAEDLDLSTKKQTVYVVIATNIIDLLSRLGVTLDDDVVGETKLRQLITLTDFFFELREYQDTIGLKGLLESFDIPPVIRYLKAMELYWGEEFDMSEYECLVEDVSEVTIKAIKDALFNPDDVETAPEPIQKRIIANKAFFEDTLAKEHITKGGQLGGSMLSFLGFYKDRLEDLLENNMVQYAKEVVAFYLVSDINSEFLKDKATDYLYSMINDINVLNKVEAMLAEVVIPS